jgi:hypothetical protein
MYFTISIIFFLAALGLGVVSLKGRTMMPGLIFFSFCIGLESLILGLLNQKIGVWQIIATIVVIAATSLAEIRSRKIPRTAFFITLIAVASVLGIALFDATWVLITLIVVAVIAMLCSPKGSNCGHTKRIILLVLAIATILFVCVLSLMTFTPRQTSSTAASKTTVVTPTATPTPTNEKTDPVTGLPIVDGGNPAEPISGTDSNSDPRTPVVREGDVVANWAELDALLGADTSYTECVNATTGLNWSSDVPKFKLTESLDGNDPRFILAVNTTATDEAIRKIASDGTGEDLSGLEILRVDAIINTRGFTTGQCREFLDRRSMVRVSLGLFLYNPDGSVKGLQAGKGVFVDCHNPWRLPTPTPTKTSTPVPTETTATPTPTPKPNPTPTNAPKDPKKDPAAQGNAPVGSGVNQDPGPGNYVAPTAAPTPPVESRVNPTPPAPTVPTAAPTAATTAAPAATPTPTPVDVAVGDPTSVGTPAIPN